MKAFVLALAVAFGAAASFPDIAEARRIGGGGAAGMQRSMPPAHGAGQRPRPPGDAPRQPRRRCRPCGRCRSAGKRSWMGPIAGLAAGLGLAALFSHLGLGAELANFVMMALLVVGAHLPGPLPDASLHALERDAERRRRRATACSSPAPGRGRRAAHPAAADVLRRRAARASARQPRRQQCAPIEAASFAGGSARWPWSRRRRPGRIRRRWLRTHRQDDLHPHAGGQRHRRPERPARLHDAGDVRDDQARPAGTRRRRRSRPTSCASTPRCSTSPRKPTARSSASASTA